MYKSKNKVIKWKLFGKRFLAGFLCITLAVGSNSVSVFAAENEPPVEAADDTAGEVVDEKEERMKVSTGQQDSFEDSSVTETVTVELSEYDGADVEARLETMRSENDIAWGTSYNIAWVIDKDGLLTIEGSGSYGCHSDTFGESVQPWYEYREFVKSAKVNMEYQADGFRMFYLCKNLITVDIVNLNTHDMWAQASMDSMFEGCSSLETVNLSAINTSGVSSMERMFYGCSSLRTLNLANFDVSHVLVMDYIEVKGKEASCTEEGVKDYYICDCGKAFEDEVCTTEIADIDTWKVIPPLGHDLSEEQFDDEYHWKKCKRCGSLSEKQSHVYDSDNDANKWLIFI